MVAPSQVTGTISSLRRWLMTSAPLCASTSSSQFLAAWPGVPLRAPLSFLIEGGTIQIVVSRPEEHMVAFAVVDDGVGIDVENLERIFNHGFTTKGKEASGFGLHTSANTASEMGGSLTVHSDGLGKGARFLLELPFREDEDPSVKTRALG